MTGRAKLTALVLSLVPPGAGAVAAVGRSEIIYADDPDTRWAWLRLRDGLCSGRNLLLLRHEKPSRAVIFWRSRAMYRRHPLPKARRIRLSALIGYAIKTLTLDKATRLLSPYCDAELAVIALPCADAAVDAGKAADLSLVERALAARRAA